MNSIPVTKKYILNIFLLAQIHQKPTDQKKLINSCVRGSCAQARERENGPGND